MNRDKFIDGINKIYSVFGAGQKTKPLPAVILEWFNGVEHIPDGAVNFIVEKICDMERLPANMPRAWKNLWSDWKTANPSRIISNNCPQCAGSGVRYCWTKKADGNWISFVTFCPACHTNPSQNVATLQELESKGCVVMPTNYPGGQVAYDREKGFYALTPKTNPENCYRPSSMPHSMRAAIGHTEKRRAAHDREIEKANYGNF